MEHAARFARVSILLVVTAACGGRPAPIEAAAPQPLALDSAYVVTVLGSAIYNSSSWPSDFAVLGGAALFKACTADLGCELWKTDGAADGAGTVLVADIAPGRRGSAPADLVAVNGAVLFVADDGGHGAELWRSDGTGGGTTLVADLHPGVGSSTPRSMVLLGTGGVFWASAETGTVRLFFTDGTGPGTIPLSPPSLGAPLGIARLGGLAYGTTSRGVFVTDGTPEGTRLLSSTPACGGPVASGDRIFFSGGSPCRIWSSDGTEPGAVPGAPAPASSLAAVPGGAVWVGVPDGATERQLFFTDGSSVVQLTSDLVSASAALVGAGGKAFLVASSAGTGAEVFVTDGTTARALDLTAGNAGSSPGTPVRAGDRVLFNATVAPLARGAWVSDGTDAGTVRVGAGTVSWDDGAALDGKILFGLGAEPIGTELAIWDGAGLASVNVAVERKDGVSLALWGASVGGSLCFTSRTGSVLRTDGTPAGTVRVPGLTYGNVLGEVDGACLVHGYRSGEGVGVYRLDGTSPQRLAGPSTAYAGGPGTVARFGSTLLFVGTDSTSGTEVWGTDGTAANTGPLVDAFAGSGGSWPRSLAGAGSRGWFTAKGTDGAYRLYATDGSPPGTAEVARTSSSYFTGVAAESDRAWFATGDGWTGWIDAVTLVGTAAHVAGNIQQPPVAANRYAAFLLSPGSACELWRTDGTPGGTRRVVPLADTYCWNGPQQLVESMVSLNGLLLFTYDDGPHGHELWRSGGSAATTGLVADILPGFTGAVVGDLYPVPSQGIVLFAATDGITGTELWESDGTEAGTRRVQDLAPGAEGSFPARFFTAGDKVYFSADGGAGRELWALPLPPGTPYDGAAPLVDCPPDAVVEATGPQGAPVSFPDPVAVDNLTVPGELVVAVSTSSGSTFPAGTTTVTATTSDAAGNPGSCTFTITVRDATAPTIACPAPVVAEATGPGGAAVTWETASALDAVGVASVSSSPEPGTILPIGVTTVTVTARDGAGNPASCTFAATVRDTTAPALTCPADVHLVARGGAGARASFELPVATDAVTASPEVTSTPTADDPFPLGSTTVTVTATDQAGNAATCTFAVVVARAPDASSSGGCGCGSAPDAGLASLLVLGIARRRARRAC